MPRRNRAVQPARGRGRQQVREARKRMITRRWNRAKNVALPYDGVTIRRRGRDMQPLHAAAAWLDDRHARVHDDSSWGAIDGVPADLAARLPQSLRERLSGQALRPMGRLADHDDFRPRRWCWCASCWPKGLEVLDGQRSRQNSRWRRQEPIDWGDELDEVL